MFTAVLPIGNWSNNGTRARQERSDGVPARITVHPRSWIEARLTAGTMRMRRCNTRQCFDPSAEKLTCPKSRGVGFWHTSPGDEGNEWPLTTQLSRSRCPLQTAGVVKGFGCRPVVTIRVRSEGRRPKASQEGTGGPPGGRLPSMGI